MPMDVHDNPLINDDLAPTAPLERTWSMWNIAALWVGMSVCTPTYMIASGMIGQGMAWWQATLTVLVGNAIVLLPMILNGHPGTKYGIPFPVLVRSSFGISGAHVPSIARALVACGWFGIQTWIGGAAIYSILDALGWIHAANDVHTIGWLGITITQLLCFLAFWALHVVVIIYGINSIKWLEAYAAPMLLVAGGALFVWALVKVDDPKALFTMKSTFATPGAFWKVFFPQLTAMVGFWATLSLNIPDFTRYCRSQRDQAMGQIIGLPPTMTMFCFIGIIVTSATVAIYGQAIWDPVELTHKLGAKSAVIIAMLALLLATISTNLAANVVSPANGFSNLAPRAISFRTGALATCVIGIVMMPWKLLASSEGYIFTWLIGYGALLGPIAGIMLCDYFIVRKTKLSATDLYDARGKYRGVRWQAMVALVLAVLPNLPGFINAAAGRTNEQYRAATTAMATARAKLPAEVFDQKIAAGELNVPRDPIFPEIFDDLYGYAWFIGVPVSVVLYAVFMIGHYERKEEN